MILVTGLTGLVGSGLMLHLVSHPEILKQCVAICRESSDVSHIEPYCTIERGSSWDSDFLDRVCEKYSFETIIHISNKGQIVQFSELARKHHVRKVILISSTYACSVKHPNNGQLKDEDKCVEICNASGISYIILRPTAIFDTRPDGKRDRNISVFSDYVNKLPLFPLFAKGRATVQPAWGGDIGLALYLCLIHFDELKNRRLIASGDVKRTFRQMIVEIGRSNGKRVRFFYVPGWLARLCFYSLYYLSFKKKDFRERIDRLLEDRAFDTSQELLELGYRAKPFSETLGQSKITY